jgi:hypothetical protein
MRGKLAAKIFSLLMMVTMNAYAGAWPPGNEAEIRARFPRASTEVLAASRRASRETSVPYDYLLAAAALESGFRPDAKAATSSALGLYQFIEQTWLATLKTHGARHGLAELAAAIERGRSGRAYVAQPHLRRKILDLRRDPRVAALMAGELARENADILRRALGRRPRPTELYLAHVLGARGAARFLDTMQARPQLAASRLFPAAARANPTLFYQGTRRRPRSLDQLYGVFDTKMQASA